MPEEEAATQIPAKTRNLIIAVFLTGAFIAILNQTLLAVAIPSIMADLNVSANTAQWVTTVFMLVNGIMIPITAFLIEKFTTRGLFLFAMCSFALGTLFAALSPTFGLLMAGRVIQGVGAGIMIPLMQTSIMTMFPISKRGQAMGLAGLAIAFAPAFGPTLSGWVVDSYSWNTLFYIILPIAIVDIILAYFLLKNVTELKHPKLDLLSIMLSTAGFGGLLYGFSAAGNNGWGSTTVLTTLAVGAVALFLFIWRQLHVERPILEFRVLKNPIFTLTVVVAMACFVSMVGSQTLIPLYVQNARGFSALDSGLMLLPGALIMGLMSPITGRIFDKVGGRGLAITGLSLLTVGTIPYMFLTEDSSIAFLTTMFALRMLGVAMVMMPMTTAGLNQLPNSLIAHGTAMTNTLRQVAGSIGTAVLITVMSQSASGAAQAGEVSSQSGALIHGINVAFFVALIAAVVGLVLSFFLKNTRPDTMEKREVRGSKTSTKESKA